MKTFFSEIKDKILADVPEIQTVELWNSQVGAALEDKEFPIVTPAVYFEVIDQILYTDRTDKPNSQQGKFTLRLNIVVESLVENEFNDSGTDWDVFDTKQDVFKSVQGFKTSVSQEDLNRIDEELDTDHNGLYVFAQDYSADIIDEDAVPETVPVDAELCVDGHLQIDNVVIRTGRGTQDLGGIDTVIETGNA